VVSDVFTAQNTLRAGNFIRIIKALNAEMPVIFVRLYTAQKFLHQNAAVQNTAAFFEIIF